MVSKGVGCVGGGSVGGGVGSKGDVTIEGASKE